MQVRGCALFAIRCSLFAVAFPCGPLNAAPTEPAQAVDPILHDYLSGNGFLNRGLNELAVAEYRKFLSAQPQHAKAAIARYGLAVALFRLGQFDEAVAELATLQQIADFEYAAEVAVMAGQCHLAAGRFDQAVAAFESQAERSIGHELGDDAAAGLIEALHRNKQHEAALRSGEDFVSRWPGSTLRDRVEFFAGLSQMAKGDHAAAAQRFAAFLQTYKESPLIEQVSLRLAQCLQRTDQGGEAIRHYQKVLEGGKPELLSDALLALGSLYHQAGQQDQAAEMLDRFLQTYSERPEVGRAGFLRAQVHFAKGEFVEARKGFDAAAKADTAIADSCAFWAAKCLLRQEKYAEAAKKLRAASEKHADSTLLPEMLYDRAVALLRADQAADAVAALEAFHARFSSHALGPAAVHLLAGIAHRNADYANSAKWCKEFLGRFAGDVNAGDVAFLAAENDFLSGEFGAAAGAYKSFLASFVRHAQADQARYRLGMCLYRLHKHDEAEPLLTQAAGLAESNSALQPALLALGDIHFGRGEWKTAETHLSKYLAGAGDAGGEDALIKLAYAKQQQQRFEEALADYELFLSRHAGSVNRVQAEFERGQVLLSLKRTDDARASFEKVAKEDSKFRAYALNHLGAIALQRGDSKAAAELYARAAKAPDAAALTPDLLFQEAQAHLAGKEFAKAEQSLRRLLDDHADYGKSGPAAAQLAIALSRQNRHQDALAAIEGIENKSMAALDPGIRASLLYEKAWCLRTLERGDEAAAAYRKLLASSSEGDIELHALLELGELEAAAKRFAAAVEVLNTLEQKLRLAPGSGNAELREKCLYRLGICAFELEHHERAIELLDALIEQFPKSALAGSALFFGGEAAFKLGRHEKSAACFERLAKDFSGDPAAGPGMLRAGEAFAVLQRWPSGERILEDYLSRFADSPSWYQAQFGIGWAMENQKRHDEAIRAYKQVIGKHQGPTAARAQFQIGQCLFAKGAYEDAARELLKVDILYAYPQWSAAALYEAGRCFTKLGKPAEAQRHFQQVAEKFSDTEWAKLATKQLAESTSSAAVPGR